MAADGPPGNKLKGEILASMETVVVGTEKVECICW